MNEQVTDTIKLPPMASVDYTELTDEDIRQLVIHIATIVRDPARRKEVDPLIKVFCSWPEELKVRFQAMVFDEADSKKDSKDMFWARPADNNIRWGSK